MLQELAEQLSISFYNKFKLRPQGHARARARGALIELQNPSDGITHAGAIEISRLSHPPTSDRSHAKLRCFTQIADMFTYNQLNEFV